MSGHNIDDKQHTHYCCGVGIRSDRQKEIGLTKEWMERTAMRAEEARNVLYSFVAAAATSATADDNFGNSVITVKINVV